MSMREMFWFALAWAGYGIAMIAGIQGRDAFAARTIGFACFSLLMSMRAARPVRSEEPTE
jgi:hypothetical protein